MCGKTTSMKEALSRGRNVLEQAGVADADLDAWYLLEYVTGVDRAHYLADPGRMLDPQRLSRYEEAVRRRAERIPLQHITGEQEFMGLVFRVNGNVLIPRQDTEILVEQALGLFEKNKVPSAGNRRILDLCTGSGCILLSILHWGKVSGGVGADLSPEALRVAEENAERIGQDHAEFICSDLFAKIAGTFDMIVSNPPYIRTEEIGRLADEVRLHDPLLALDGKEDGLFFYRKITEGAGEHLVKGGYLLFEIGCGQAADVTGMMSSAGFEEISVVKDLAGLDRVVQGRWPGRTMELID